ncbi:MAG: aspartate carbamoyltransferase regulatory subunit [Eubacterium coprostanoligenes]|nr:aspartate carbamoyltransferase regulatory subunit [Eubacterium coprostanoligenes]MCI6353997.1 aspartate carbamoyltransferase regulatory subunit [Eubacterium coprostanoligenes]MCI6361808.1 aspartate carbamoyltransferase regulatory subunit [Eubacterium coprostanoligenes]MCI7265423.1 aspartate carbamoyltransferase regulatory subunit [Eubacterium coprostanoligenes]MDD6666112.1 aspartate carbamoyltransferase regulatory subunit [Eubacterium coprostanoligenes]MDY4699143.1 aspartate carbamoyltransf
MNIDSIENGYVIDHIPAGKGMQIYNVLSLDKLNCQVAIITNAKSQKNDVKDIIKINELVELDLDIIAFIAPEATVNVIKDSQRIDKKLLSLPKEIKNIVKCPNPRCISNNEDIDHIFKLTDDKGTYRCLYCETMAL